MSFQRPPHMDERQMRGRAFSEPLTIQYITADRNAYGEATESVARQAETLCATAPVTGTAAARMREIMVGGIQLNAMRTFWTAEELDPVSDDGPGDILIYPVDPVDPALGERWRVSFTQRWGTFSESIAVRQEGQT